MSGRRVEETAVSAWIGSHSLSIRAALADLASQTTPVDTSRLPQRIRDYLKEAESQAATHEFLDLTTCRQAATLATRIAEMLPGRSPVERRIAELAVEYFLATGDGEDDFTSPAGFDDDLQVLKSALSALEPAKAERMADAGTFAPGSRIEARNEEWIVRSAHPVGGGNHALRVVGVSELVRGFEAIFLTDLEKPRPLRVDEAELVLDSSQGHRRTRLYIEALLRRSPPTDARLHVGHRAAMRTHAFQLRPAEDALKALRPRILIADGVGLGKTLEVGILLSELIRRGRGERILVVVLKSMLEQFQKELWTRFTIPLVRLDTDGLTRVRAKIPVGKNPFQHFKRAIISIDTLKGRTQYRDWLAESRWDAVVIDECHNAMNIGTGRHRVASLLGDTSDALILTSATPHNGRPESFANLINMLEPTAIANPLEYGPEDIKGLYRRRFKKDVENEVAESFPARDPKLEVVAASAPEEAVFKALHEAKFHTLDRKVRLASKGRPRDMLFRTTLLKSFLSSPTALMETCSHRLANLQKAVEDAEARSVSTRELEADVHTMRHIEHLAGQIDLDTFTKIKHLLHGVLPSLDIHGHLEDPRIVIFSERIATLKALESCIRAHFNIVETDEKFEKHRVIVLTGAESDERIRTALEAFTSRDGKVRILLASDVLSEGINLHHACSRLIHFDIPWSLIRLEQRTGRIDRYGQLEVPRLRYMLTRSKHEGVKSDLRVIETLIEKEREAEHNLGDQGALMRLYKPELEEQAVATMLSEQKSFDEVVGEVKEELQAGATDSGGHRADEEADEEDGDAVPWFLERLKETDDSATDDPPAIAGATSLFTDDLAFLTAGLEEVRDRIKAEGEDLDIEMNPERPEVQFTAPIDLRKRFEDLPRAARPQNGRVWLSTDRPAIEKAIAASREQQGAWPGLQLLWPLHPVMDWISDRLLVAFGRQQTPVVVAPALAAAGHDAIALMEGTISNHIGRPIIVDWFGLPTQLSPKPKVGEPIDIATLMESSGLKDHLPNTGRGATDLKKLEMARPLWRDAAVAHMKTLREARGSGLKLRLKDAVLATKRWEERTLERLEEEEAALVGKLRGGVLDRRRLRLAEVRESVKRRQTRRQEWLNKEFSTDERPFLRLVAVFVTR